MRVLVTGGGGFIGRYALPLLVQRGHEVHACHIEPSPPVDVPGVCWRRVDLHTSGPDWVRSIKPNGMLHLAWYAVHGLFWRSPENLRWVATSLELVRAFAESGGNRFVGAGTCAEYDWNVTAPLSESTSALAPSTLYGVSKDAFRRVLESYALQQGFSFAWGRVFFLYGVGEDERRFVPSVMRALLRGIDASCSHGRQIRDFMYVEDVAAAFVSILESNVIGSLNVGSGVGVSLAAVAEMLEEMIGSGHVRLGALEAREGDPPFLVAEVAKLRTGVGFTPKFSLETGLAKMIDWARDARRQ